MSEKEELYLVVAVGVGLLGLGYFIYLSAEKTSGSIQSAANGTNNINALAGTINGFLNNTLKGSQQ